MELLLVRHARPEVVFAGGTIADPPLTEEGRAQAQLLAKALAGGLYGPVTAVVTSTMQRAIQTAEPSTEALGVVAETDERIVELDQGWTTYGTGLDAYPTREDAWRSMNSGTWGSNTFDPIAFRARVRAGIDDIAGRHADGSVAVVCHGGVISAYLAEVLGVARSVFFSPDYCSVSRVLAEPGYRELLSANETLHMRLA